MLCCDARGVIVVEIISDVTERESLEFPSFAPDENKFSPVDSLGNISDKKIARPRLAMLKS